MIIRRLPILAVTAVGLGALVLAGRDTEEPVGGDVRASPRAVDARRLDRRWADEHLVLPGRAGRRRDRRRGKLRGGQ